MSWYRNMRIHFDLLNDTRADLHTSIGIWSPVCYYYSSVHPSLDTCKMTRDYIAGEAPLVPDDLVIWVVDYKMLIKWNRSIIESIPYGSSSTDRAFRIMTIGDMHTKLASIT